MAAVREFVRKHGSRLLVAAGSFLMVSLLILVQQQREVLAQDNLQSTHQKLLLVEERAQALGLDGSEWSDLLSRDQAALQASAPQGTPPFNQSRIDFFLKSANQELAVLTELTQREDQLLDQAKTAADQSLNQADSNIARARQIGVEEDFLKPLQPRVDQARTDFVLAETISAYRKVSDELKAPLSKLALIIADQQAANTLATGLTAQVASQDGGDIGKARAAAAKAITSLNGDLQTAHLFSMDTSVIDIRMQHLTNRLGQATTLTQVEQIAGGLLAQDKILEQTMSTALPAKALVISLKDQTLRAYDHGQQVFWSYVTTGRPGLETDPGNFKVYSKVSPFTMHSPWPKGSPYWYPDTKVRMVMWFNGGDGIHDAYWRSVYGPGTEYPHYDPTGEDTGTHGCVNVPLNGMYWLWNWTPVGTPVIVY